MSALSRVLIANRGEIAIRIARAAAGCGIESVAVHAPIDHLGLHTRVADVSVALPEGSDPVAAYLNVAAIVAAAKAQGCDCVHPGYGFLSENAELAQACADNGITFIGPSPATLRLFGDKVAAKALALAEGVPVVPGSDAALTTVADAERFVTEHGLPVMLKAAAGGGGRGMRAVHAADELAEAFERCASEAQRRVRQRRRLRREAHRATAHIEVQIIADAGGSVVHFFERDCSIQQRHQKVVEIAPAPRLDGAIRERIFADALKLAKAAGYANAGTVEFLVEPESGAYYFIECNPRIQVEHTITEQVMGVDLVETQFRIAAGASLAQLGFGDQAAVGEPRGFAIQTRIVAQGAGTISAYREPAGMGIRVDGHAYVGYAPPPQFDPLLGKLICYHPSASYTETVDRMRRALDEFHIAGLATNLNQLRGILADATVRDGDARTTLLAEISQDFSPNTVQNETLALLDRQAKTVNGGGRSVPVPSGSENGMDIPDGARAAECPMAGSVVQVSVAEGDEVRTGDTLMVISAMKMETAVLAPCTGRVVAVAALLEGDAVSAGEVVVAVVPDADAAETEIDRDNSWLPTLEEVSTLQRLADARLGPDSEEPGVVRQRGRGKLHCRQRIDLLLDEGTFREIGSLAGFASYDVDGTIDAFTPANHVGGWGTIEGRSRSSAPTTSHPAAVTPTARSAPRARISTACRWSCGCRPCACSMAPPAAAAWRRWSRNRRRRARAKPRRAPARSRQAARGCPAPAARSYLATSAPPCTPNNSTPYPS